MQRVEIRPEPLKETIFKIDLDFNENKSYQIDFENTNS